MIVLPLVCRVVVTPVGIRLPDFDERIRYDLIVAIEDLAAQRDSLPSGVLVNEDLIGGVAFFLSDHSAFVNGQNMSVDGGGIIP